MARFYSATVDWFYSALDTVPTHKSCSVYNLAFEAFHGMEEVVGSIPTRSTKSFQAFSATSVPRLCRIFVANSKTTPRAGFAGTAET